MSMILRSLLRDPTVARYARPSSRAIRRWDSDFFDDWPLAAPVRRPWRAMTALEPHWDDRVMSRDLADAVNQLQEFADEMDSMVDSWHREKRARLGDAGELTMQRSADGSLQLAMDVSGFKPENLNIELVDDHLVVEAKNESSAENSYSKSEMRRWFKLPEDCKLEEIQSSLTADNKLLISLPSSRPAVEHKTRKIPIKVDQRNQQQLENNKASGDQHSTNTASKQQQAQPNGQKHQSSEHEARQKEARAA